MHNFLMRDPTMKVDFQDFYYQLPLRSNFLEKILFHAFFNFYFCFNREIPHYFHDLF